MERPGDPVFLCRFSFNNLLFIGGQKFVGICFVDLCCAWETLSPFRWSRWWCWRSLIYLRTKEKWGIQEEESFFLLLLLSLWFSFVIRYGRITVASDVSVFVCITSPFLWMCGPVYYTGEKEEEETESLWCISGAWNEMSASLSLFLREAEEEEEKAAVMEMRFRSRLSINNHAVYFLLLLLVRSSACSVWVCVARSGRFGGMMMAVVVGEGPSIFSLLIATWMTDES